MSLEEDQQRYLSAAHGMQSGVAMKMQHDPNETSPKHLRVGVNSAMVQNGALIELLIEKGVFSAEEWYKTLADAMENERNMYADEISKLLGGVKVNLA